MRRCIRPRSLQYSDMYEYKKPSEKSDEDKADIPDCRLIYTAHRGFHLSISCADPRNIMKLPSRFIEVVRNRASLSCTTRALIRYNGKFSFGLGKMYIFVDFAFISRLQNDRSRV